MSCFPQEVGKQGGLTIRCKACGHIVRWSDKKATRLLGYSTGPVQASKMLKCSKCEIVGQVDFV
jgi:hypothetical protein